MKCYAIATLTFKSTVWIQDYLKHVTPMVEKVGGKYLSRTSQLELIEGEGPLPQSVIIIEFPSREAAEAFYYSDEYQPYKEARQKGSSGEFMLVAGEDIAAR